MSYQLRFTWYILLILSVTACDTEEERGIWPATPAATTVKMDFQARPLPEIPLPNDIATRYDKTSPTGRRVNASMIAPTRFEQEARELIGNLDGWGVGQPITIPFTAPLSIDSILDGHRDRNYDSSNDVIYVINITKGSPDEGRLHTYDIGEGNFPLTLKRGEYWENDPRAWTLTLFFDEEMEDLDGDGILDDGEDLNGNGLLDEGEDLNGNGRLDPPEDTDADGVLDVPNYYPGLNPPRDDIGARADALMYFYEKQTNTLILQPLEPLRERNTYAVVVTRRLKDHTGKPVGSPYPYINHHTQSEALRELDKYLPHELELDDVAFAFSFTTQTVESDFIAVRDGLYGHGIQGHIGEMFPPRVEYFLPMMDTDHPRSADAESAFTLSGPRLRRVLSPVLEELTDDTSAYDNAIESNDYIAAHMMGIFNSPQLFPRHDRNGNKALYNDQIWPPDLTSNAAPVRSEEVPFWLSVPNKAVSRRGNGEPAPVAILSHGYTSSRIEGVMYAGAMAQRGVATVAIECPSHGFHWGPTPTLYEDIFAGFGLEPLYRAINTHRAIDLNGDDEFDEGDSGGDFWTAYLFHTRDMVRQCALDHMALVRVLRSFDGERRWEFDVNGDGENDIAGDIDGDGIVDFGGPDGVIGMWGGSLGGIMSSILGGLEPKIDVVAPIAGGGGLGNVGARSQQGGVREAMMLRSMGPLFLGQIEEGGLFQLNTVVPDERQAKRLPIASVPGVKVGDTMVVKNLHNGERGCGYISQDKSVRAGIAADIHNFTNINAFVSALGDVPKESEQECALACQSFSKCIQDTCGRKVVDYGCENLCASGEDFAPPVCAAVQTAVNEDGSLCLSLEERDKVVVEFYAGPQLIPGDEHCGVKMNAQPYATIDTFGEDIEYQASTFEKGSPLTVLAQGLGFRRATPSLRRFLGIGQLVVDPADPAVYARHCSKEPIYYAGTDETTGAHAVVITTLGDMSVPASSGVHLARSAGFVNYRHPDPAYRLTRFAGSPPNQILLDTFVAESVNIADRFCMGPQDEIPLPNEGPCPEGSQGVHLDVENLSQGTDLWGDTVPRLEIPLRLGLRPGQVDRLGGVSGALFLMGEPTGQHGFDSPGVQEKRSRQLCQENCPNGEDCQCDTRHFFDIGTFMLNSMGGFLESGGKRMNLDLCNGTDTCPGQPNDPERATMVPMTMDLGMEDSASQRDNPSEAMPESPPADNTDPVPGTEPGADGPADEPENDSP